MGRRMEMGSLIGRYSLYSEGTHNKSTLCSSHLTNEDGPSRVVDVDMGGKICLGGGSQQLSGLDIFWHEGSIIFQDLWIG